MSLRSMNSQSTNPNQPNSQIPQTRKASFSDIPTIFGIRSTSQLKHDLKHVFKQMGGGFQFGSSTLGFMRGDIGIPTYLGKHPRNRLSPIFHAFDRVGGGKHYSQRITRSTMTDFRGKHLGYDEHDGVDFACPIGTELVAAAPGHVVMIRDNWLRGGITVAVDHGDGLLTQYTHCWKPLVTLGQAVQRGEAVALSGSAGLDMVISFPWVSPHIHFMVWDHGTPVDPFLMEGEKDRNGTWLKRNCPENHLAFSKSETIPEYSKVNEEVLPSLLSRCSSDKLLNEIATLNDNPNFIAAYIEDALHHDSYAWDGTIDRSLIRPPQSGSTKLTLPLSAQHYDGSFFADDKIRSKAFWL